MAAALLDASAMIAQLPIVVVGEMVPCVIVGAAEDAIRAVVGVIVAAAEKRVLHLAPQGGAQTRLLPTSQFQNCSWRLQLVWSFPVHQQ